MPCDITRCTEESAKLARDVALDGDGYAAAACRCGRGHATWAG